MTVHEAIVGAEQILPGAPAPDGQIDSWWQAIIAIGVFIETNPDDVLVLVARWSTHHDEDLRNAIATCLLEHRLEFNFEMIFPMVEQLLRDRSVFRRYICEVLEVRSV